MRSSEEMAPTKKCVKDGEENAPRNSVVKNLPLREGGPPAEVGSLIDDKIMAAAMGPLGGIHAQWRGDGAHKDGR